MLRTPVLRVLNATVARSYQATPKLTRAFASTGKPTVPSKAATGQGTGANNEGAGVGTGINQPTYQNSEVKGSPVNPAAVSKGQHATKHSQTTPVTGQQKPSPTAGTPDAVGASARGQEQSINAATKPVHHNNKTPASTHTQNTHSTGQHTKPGNASHSHQSHTSHNSSDTHAASTSTTGSMDMATAAASAKSKAQDLKDKVTIMIHEAGSEIPEGKSYMVIGSVALFSALFILLNPDRRYIKRVYNTVEKPRIQALQHPTTY